MKKTNIYAYLSWVSICIIWGTTYLVIRIGVESLPPMLFAGIRWVVAGPILLLVLRLKKIKFPNREDFKHIAFIGILLIGFANAFVVVAEQWIPTGLASLLITTLPFWIVIFEFFIPNSYRINRIVFFGLLLGFLGILLIFWNELENLINTEYFLGILAILGAAFSWSIGSLYSKYKRLKTHPLMSASFQMIIAGCFQISIGLILGEQNSFSLDRNGFLSMLYLIIFGSLFGYAAYIYAISVLPVSLVATYTYINPMIAIFLGWFILDERINATMIFAAIIILSGVALVQYGNLKQEKNKKIPA